MLQNNTLCEKDQPFPESISAIIAKNYKKKAHPTSFKIINLNIIKALKNNKI